MAKSVILTDRQHQIVKALRKEQRKAGVAPTQASLARKLGIRQHTLSEHLTNLALKGVVTKYGQSNRIVHYEIAKARAV
jgi:DNA-binding MarR family transcriptional regulator